MITSTSNERIKEIRKLREKKYRSQSGLFLAEGTKIVLDAIQKSAPIQQLIIAPELVHTEGARKAIQLGNQQNLDILEVSSVIFSTISNKENPQGVAAVIQQKWANFDDVLNKFSGIWLALFEVADPGNLGTIMRTMDAAGGKGIFLIDNCTDPYDPASIRGSMGAVFTQKLVQTKKSEFSSRIYSQSIFMIGTSDAAETDFHEISYHHDMILLMGSEREGLPKDLQSSCAGMVSIPMLGTSDSLNLAVAASVVLYEILEQTETKKRTRK